MVRVDGNDMANLVAHWALHNNWRGRGRDDVEGSYGHPSKRGGTGIADEGMDSLRFVRSVVQDNHFHFVKHVGRCVSGAGIGGRRWG